MTDYQKHHLSEYITEYNKMFSIDEHDYSINEIIEENPKQDSDTVYILFVEYPNGVISSYIAVFKNNCWQASAIKDGKLSGLAPIKFYSEAHKAPITILGYLPYRKPFDGTIKKEDVSKVLCNVELAFPLFKFKEKVENGLVTELFFKTDRNYPEKFKVRYYMFGNAIEVLGERRYYQCKTESRLILLIEWLLKGDIRLPTYLRG